MNCLMEHLNDSRDCSFRVLNKLEFGGVVNVVFLALQNLG